jgi:hypothetical protein
MDAPIERVAQEHERLDSTMATASDVPEAAALSHDAITPEALAQLPGDNYRTNRSIRNLLAVAFRISRVSGWPD